MKNRFYRLVALSLSLLILAGGAAAAEKAEAQDGRTLLPMGEADKAYFLSEMRQMLASIQGVMTGIGTKDRALIYKSAKYSGNRMSRATPDSVRRILPQGFKELGGPTHLMFEELAVRSETDDMGHPGGVHGPVDATVLGLSRQVPGEVTGLPVPVA